MNSPEDIENLLYSEKKDLISKWSFMYNKYEEIEYKKYFHRTELKHVDYIKDIKIELYDKLGAFPVFVFLTDYFYKLEFPGAYYHMDKGLLILYHLVSGLSINKMHKYINYTTFFKIYKRFYVYYKKELKEWINKMMYSNYFTSNIIRLLYAKINNPNKIKNVTCYIDGYDSRIAYQDIAFDKKRLYSFKFKKPGFRTQFIIDINNIIIYISPSLPCSDYTDGQMLQNIKLERYITISDCILLDGGYPLYIEKLIEDIDNRGFDINWEYFIYPFRKEKDKELTENQLQFNDEINSLRSDVESFFATFTKLFLRFNKQNVVSVTEKEIYNEQMRLASILYNIKQAIKIYDIKLENEYYYSLWSEEKYKFKRKNDNDTMEFVLESNFHIKQENINNKNKYQDELIANLIHKKLNITETNNMIIDDNIFEVEKIIDHKRYRNKIKYLIKWVGYDEPTWEIEDNIIDKDCIKDYRET